MDNKPLTVDEVVKASEQFFPLFYEVNSRMPNTASVEDTLKVMETVCTLAQKLRMQDQEEKIKFGFNKNETSSDIEAETVG
jgi:hypothetical protein